MCRVGTPAQTAVHERPLHGAGGAGEISYLPGTRRELHVSGVLKDGQAVLGGEKEEVFQEKGTACK